MGVRDLDRVDPREGRRVGLELRGEPVQGGALAFRLDQDALPVVEDEARQLDLPCEPVHERPEADALDDPPHTDAATFHSGILRERRAREHDRPHLMARMRS